jgi:tripartite-type tricarboxylate transporter receptor subunit TctC
VRGFAVTTRERVAAVPDIPTIAESGVPGFDVFSWFGFFVPAKTPPDIVARINADTNAALTYARPSRGSRSSARPRKARRRASLPPS